MSVRRVFRSFSRGVGHRLYAASGPALRAMCRTASGRAAVAALMRAGGRALLWAFGARGQPNAAGAKREWERILGGIGLNPQPAPANGTNACATCFARCTLDLKPGDAPTCDTVMSINDEMLTRLGGRMVIVERLTDPGATRCVVRVEDVPQELRRPSKQAGEQAGEQQPWCDDATAEGHFDGAAAFYDFMMGYFEMPANLRALRGLELHEHARVAELGVGTGLALAALLAHLPASGHVVGIDRSRGMIDRARRRITRHGLARRVEFVRADATATELPSSAFDYVYSSFLLDQFDVDKRRAALAEARRLLKPGAGACFVVMDGAAEGRLDRALAALYNAFYGRWNPVWMALFAGYAPHCRPVHLGELLREGGFVQTRRDRSLVACFPVAIHHVVRA